MSSAPPFSTRRAPVRSTHKDNGSGARALNSLIAAYERQAYDLQIKWLREQGVDDPYALIGINELGIYMLSVCRDGS